mmetsp:Transcript_3894/g.11508  ORF Transcript_3894/g.11508 Transcript_3894/m.11508 type:complete len:92 (+) Transcript_3894:441-716(+)
MHSSIQVASSKLCSCQVVYVSLRRFVFGTDLFRPPHQANFVSMLKVFRPETVAIHSTKIAIVAIIHRTSDLYVKDRQCSIAMPYSQPVPVW